MFQFGYARVVKERAGGSSTLEALRRDRGGQAPARKPYLGALLHIAIRFTPECEQFCPQSSKGRSDSFFDRRAVIKAGAVRFKMEH